MENISVISRDYINSNLSTYSEFLSISYVKTNLSNKEKNNPIYHLCCVLVLFNNFYMYFPGKGGKIN